MLSHIRKRRRELSRAIDVKNAFEKWEESCVPSYLHPNLLAAYVSWRRLFVAARMASDLLPQLGRVLDFGSSVGELSRLLNCAQYDFVEMDDTSANILYSQNSRAHRTTLENAPSAAYDAVFAIDSLEHNEDYGRLLTALVRRLTPTGVLILSGPTENALYRLGRRMAGFKGDYHHTNIFDIEREAAQMLDAIALRTIPFGLPLFRITAWRFPAGSAET